MKIKSLNHFVWGTWLLLSLVFSSLYADNKQDVLRIRKVVINSNKPIPQNKYLSKLALKTGDEFNQAKANDAAKKIEELLAKDQRYNLKVEYPEVDFLFGQQVDIIYTITFFEQIKINNISFSGNRYFSKAKLKKLIFGDLNVDLNPNQMSEKLNDIVRLYSERQFLFTEVVLDSLIMENKGLRAVIVINEGKKADFKNFYFQGNKTSTEHSLLKISGLNKLQEITRNKLLQIESKILKKQYIDECELIPLDENSLMIKIKEGRMTRISTLLGYSDNSENEGLTGLVDVKFLNLFGTDRTFGVYWNRPNKVKTRIEMNYQDPGIELIPISYGLDLSRETSDSLYVQSAAEIQLEYENFYYSLGVSGSLDSFYPIELGHSLYSKTTQNKVGVSGSWDNTDYYLNPRTGNQLSFNFNKVWAKSDEESYQNEEVFTDIVNYYQLTQSFVTSIGVHGKYSRKRDLTDIYQYKLGGNQNLRGFFEDQFRGSRIGWATLELRYLLSFKSRFFAFCDYGYAEYDVNDEVTKNDDLVGVGIGFRIDTRIGVLKLDYAFGHSNSTWQNPLQGYIHIGIDAGF
jgi:outer membrane protein assembly factor BamA